MMKILHLLTTDSFSGAENVCINLIKLSQPDYSCCYCSPIGKIKDKLESENIDFLGINEFSIKEIKKAIKKYNPDIIHAHDIRASVYATMCSKKIPVISHIHGKFNDMSVISPRSILYFISSFRLKKIIYVSKSIYEEFYFKGTLDKKGVLLENKIDKKKILERLNKIEEAPSYDFTFIGRLEKVKNPIRFINLIKKIQTRFPKVKACMVGSGKLEDECRQKIIEEKINIDLVGFKEEPLYYLKNSKILVMTSISEGIPMVALESFACSKPIISTPTDGLVDIVKNDYNGFICETDDDFIDKMSLILTNQDIYSKMTEYIETSMKNEFDEYGKQLKSIYIDIHEDR